MIRLVAAVLLGLFVSACTTPHSVQLTEDAPVWDYESDPTSCLWLEGKPLLPC